MADDDGEDRDGAEKVEVAVTVVLGHASTLPAPPGRADPRIPPDLPGSSPDAARVAAEKPPRSRREAAERPWPDGRSGPERDAENRFELGVGYQFTDALRLDVGGMVRSRTPAFGGVWEQDLVLNTYLYFAPAVTPAFDFNTPRYVLA